jgi:hypothetical protein
MEVDRGVANVVARAIGYAITFAPLKKRTGVTTVVARKNGKVVQTWALRAGSKMIGFVLPRSFKGVQLTVSHKGSANTRVMLA